MSELNTKNTFLSPVVVVKNPEVLHEVVKHKLSFLLLSVIAVFAESRLVLIQSLESAQAETDTRQSKNASETETRLIKWT